MNLMKKMPEHEEFYLLYISDKEQKQQPQHCNK